MTSMTKTRQSSSPRRTKTEMVSVYTVEEAVAEAAGTFPAADAVCSLGNAFCPLPDLTEWLATLSTTQRGQRRYGISIGNITELATGQVVSHYTPVWMLPPHAVVTSCGDARIKRGEEAFLMAVQSLDFLQNAPGWDTMQRVRPVALDEDGLTFENA